MKTKKEIIDETAGAYTLSTRATREGGGCDYYQADTGRMCAVGRCVTDPSDFDMRFAGVYVGERMGLDKYLRPEYRGHDINFWDQLQGLHDGPEFWDENGLSEAGIARVAELHSVWDNQ